MNKSHTLFKILNGEVDLGSSEMGFFVILFNCFPNKPSTNVIKGFILDDPGFVFCLILLFLQPEKYGSSKS